MERREAASSAPPAPAVDLPFDVSSPDLPFAVGPEASRPPPVLPDAFQEPQPVQVLDETAPLLDYARQNQPRSHRRGLHMTGEIPILRDLPFGKPAGYGGETPFALTSGIERAADGSGDENEGIPTGLPPVLSRLETVEVGPTAGNDLEEPDGEGSIDFASEVAALQRSLDLARQRARGLMLLGLISGFLSGVMAAGLFLG